MAICHLNFLKQKKVARDGILKDLQSEDLYYVYFTCFLNFHRTDRQPRSGQRHQEHSCDSIT